MVNGQEQCALCTDLNPKVKDFREPFTTIPSFMYLDSTSLTCKQSTPPATGTCDLAGIETPLCNPSQDPPTQCAVPASGVIGHGGYANVFKVNILCPAEFKGVNAVAKADNGKHNSKNAISPAARLQKEYDFYITAAGRVGVPMVYFMAKDEDTVYLVMSKHGPDLNKVHDAFLYKNGENNSAFPPIYHFKNWLAYQIGYELKEEAGNAIGIPLRVILPMLRQIMHLVHHLHERDICHRDVKTRNFLLDLVNDNVILNVIDFGLACKCSDAACLSKDSTGWRQQIPEHAGKRPKEDHVPQKEWFDWYNVIIVMSELVGAAEFIPGNIALRLSKHVNGNDELDGLPPPTVATSKCQEYDFLDGASLSDLGITNMKAIRRHTPLWDFVDECWPSWRETLCANTDFESICQSIFKYVDETKNELYDSSKEATFLRSLELEITRLLTLSKSNPIEVRKEDEFRKFLPKYVNFFNSGEAEDEKSSAELHEDDDFAAPRHTYFWSFLGILSVVAICFYLRKRKHDYKLI